MEIFANAVLIRKFRKNLDLAHKTRCTVIFFIKIFLLALAATGIGDELSYSIDKYKVAI